MAANAVFAVKAAISSALGELGATSYFPLGLHVWDTTALQSLVQMPQQRSMPFSKHVQYSPASFCFDEALEVHLACVM
jgi:hypothetical protein